MVGRPLGFVVGLQIAQGTPLDGILDELVAFPEIDEVLVVTGRWDLIVLGRVAGPAQLNELLTKGLWQSPSFRHSETMVVIDDRHAARSDQWSSAGPRTTSRSARAPARLRRLPRRVLGGARTRPTSSRGSSTTRWPQGGWIGHRHPRGVRRRRARHHRGVDRARGDRGLGRGDERLLGRSTCRSSAWSRCAGYGSPDWSPKYCPRVAAGELHVAFGVTEPDAGTDTTSITHPRRARRRRVRRARRARCGPRRRRCARCAAARAHDAARGVRQAAPTG